MIGVNFLCPPA